MTRETHGPRQQRDPASPASPKATSHGDPPGAAFAERRPPSSRMQKPQTYRKNEVLGGSGVGNDPEVDEMPQAVVVQMDTIRHRSYRKAGRAGAHLTRSHGAEKYRTNCPQPTCATVRATSEVSGGIQGHSGVCWVVPSGLREWLTNCACRAVAASARRSLPGPESRGSYREWPEAGSSQSGVRRDAR